MMVLQRQLELFLLLQEVYQHVIHLLNRLPHLMFLEYLQLHLSFSLVDLDLIFFQLYFV